MSATNLYQELFPENMAMEDSSSFTIPFQYKIYMAVILMAGLIMYHRNRLFTKKGSKDDDNKNGTSSTRYNPSLYANSSIASIKTSKSTYNLSQKAKSQIPSEMDRASSCQSHVDSFDVPSTSMPRTMSTSLLERTNIPNQKYRKQDPQTRYDDDGTRYQCVSIPYRINKETNKVEIFMITSRNRGDYIFPGGGWEKKETGPECAQREAWEEAGVRGNVTKEVVTDQHYTSDKGNKSRLWGYLLEVTKVEDIWPELERRRKWMSIDEAEIALPEKRRIKFGALWKNGMNYFIEQSLYNPHKTTNGKNGYHHNNQFKKNRSSSK